MADIQVNLKVKADAASAAAAGRQMSDTVQRAAGMSGGTVKGGVHPSGKIPAHIAIAQLNAAKAAGGGTTSGVAAGGSVAALGRNSFLIYTFISSLRALTNAVNRSASLYAKTLQSGGMPLGFMAQRQGLANVLGVGEQEVWHYGDAVKHLNERLKFSSQINAQVNRNLTSTSWSLRILGEDFKALGSYSANQVAPGIRKTANSMSFLISKVGKGTMDVLTDYSWKVANMMTGGGMKINRDFIGWAAKKMGMSDEDNKPAPMPTVSSKRFQSSPWERMGMVIGQGVGGNPLKATEKNTRSAAQTLKEIKAFLAPRNSGNPQMKAIPNGA